MFEKIKQHIQENDGFANMANISYVEAREGYGKVSMPMEDKHLNALKSLHGGAIMTIADMAFGLAANYGQDNVMISTSLTTSFLKMAKCGPIIAEAFLLNGGKNLSSYEVKVYDGVGTLIASALVNGFRLTPRS